MVIDAHQHFWRISRGDYSWMDDTVAAIRKDILPPDLAPLAAAGGITGTVAVQAAPTVEETLFLLELADADTLIQAVVGWIDLTADVDAQLSRIDHPTLRGIRPMLQDIDDTGWILRSEVLNGLRKVAEAGLRLDALITPRHLDVMAEVVQRVPELPVVIDHCAKPDFNGTDAGEAWREGMAALAAHPQVFCKLSGLPNEYGLGWSAETLRPTFDHVLSVFGSDRLMWGSDWPVLNLAGDYAGWLETARTLAIRLTEGEKAALFGETAARFYDLRGETID